MTSHTKHSLILLQSCSCLPGLFRLFEDMLLLFDLVLQNTESSLLFTVDLHQGLHRLGKSGIVALCFEKVLPYWLNLQ